MSARDDWSDRLWKLNYATGGELANVILLPQGNQFQLVSLVIDGQTVGYTVVSSQGNMVDCWKDCKLFLRGSVPLMLTDLKGPLPPLPLDPWSPPTPGHASVLMESYEMLTRAILAAGGSLPSRFRLEGDINVDGVAEAVTMYQMPDVIKGGKPLLALSVEADFSGMTIFQSGVAHGNSDD